MGVSAGYILHYIFSLVQYGPDAPAAIVQRRAAASAPRRALAGLTATQSAHVTNPTVSMR